jgi:hypothetical protein
MVGNSALLLPTAAALLHGLPAFPPHLIPLSQLAICVVRVLATEMPWKMGSLQIWGRASGGLISGLGTDKLGRKGIEQNIWRIGEEHDIQSNNNTIFRLQCTFVFIGQKFMFRMINL